MIALLRGYLALFLLTALAAGGCAAGRWTKPGATVEDFNRGSHACGLEAQRGVFARIPVNKRLYQTCMRARGYELVPGGQWVGLRD